MTIKAGYGKISREVVKARGNVSPYPITGLRLLLSASQGVYSDNNLSTPSVNNGPVGSWADQSGNGNFVVQTVSGDQPTYKTNQINSLPAIAFNGTSSAFALSVPLQLPFYTCYAVVLQNGTANSAIFGGGVNCLEWRSDTQANNIIAQAQAEILAGNTATPTGAWFQSNVSWDNNAQAAVLRYAESADGSATENTINIANAINAIGLNNSPIAPGEYLNGSLAFLAIYAVIHTTAQRQQIETYLKSIYGVQKLPFQFTRYLTQPVILKGSTYDGWEADAVAAPGAEYDPVAAEFILTVSFWQNSTSSWASGFFTSTNLTNWTYQTGSLLSPSDGLLGNGDVSRVPTGAGFGALAGKYIFVYNVNSTSDVYFATGASLTSISSGTAIITPGTSGTGDNGGCFDPSLVYNPVNQKYECWYTGADSTYNTRTNRQICMADTPDLVTWAKEGVQFNAYWASYLLGEPNVWYANGPDGSANCRWLGFDVGQYNNLSQRSTGLAYSLYQGSNTWGSWITYGTALQRSVYPYYSWESQQTFDSCGVGPFDLGNGHGKQNYLLYAGSDNNQTTNSTDSSIGLVYTTAY